MIRTFLVALSALWLSAGAAAAQCTLPNTLTNGQNADATQVMANFNALVSCMNAPNQGYLSGLALSNNVTSPNTVINIAAGVATSSDATTSMKLASAITKNANGPWAVGSTNGCADGASGYTSLAASTWYHIFEVQRTDTGVVDVLCSKSATSPTLPASYTKQRRIGAIKTDASAFIIAFVQDGDLFRWRTPVGDVSASNPGTSAVTRTLASVPSGVRVEAHVIAGATTTAFPGFGTVYLSDLSVADVAPSATASSVSGLLGAFSSDFAVLALVHVMTDTAGQIRTRINISGATTLMFVSTLGWADRRGRDG